jgi:hypothetical protein
MKFSEVMIYFDYKISNVSRFLNISRQTIYGWHDNDRIPFDKQCVIEVLTKGKLKANKDD